MITLQNGPYGFYVQMEIEGADKPKRVSLLPSLEAETLDLETAIKLLQLPRDLGPHPDSGDSIQVLVGRYGPYLKCGKDTRPLPEGVGALAVTLEQAIAALKAPRRGRTSDPGQLLGTHPTTSVEIRIKKGRYGPYVTDGTVNASVPKDQDAASIGLQTAIDLLATRAANPRPRRSGARKTTRKKKR
jgi:DNA topoisomerase-1